MLGKSVLCLSVSLVGCSSVPSYSFDSLVIKLFTEVAVITLSQVATAFDVSSPYLALGVCEAFLSSCKVVCPRLGSVLCHTKASIIQLTQAVQCRSLTHLSSSEKPLECTRSISQ